MSADLALIASAALMGLAGTPHCAAMCGAACAGAARACGSEGTAPRAVLGALLAARLMSYAAGGAIAAAAVAGLQALEGIAPALRVLWTMLHAAALGLGLWLLVTGRQPAWWARLGRAPVLRAATATAPVAGGVAVVPLATLRRPLPPPLKAGLVGSAWVMLPCGLLQSALVVAALASGPVAGAAVMAGFALASVPGLLVLPLWLQRRGGQAPGWSLRLAGALLAAAALFALGHGLWQRIAAYCLS